MHLRPATSDDTSFLRELHHRVYRNVVLRQFGVWDEAAQDGWFKKSLSEARFSVVETDGHGVGAIGLNNTAEALRIAELQIMPEWQCQGLGTALLQQQLERARTLNKPVLLSVLLQNRARLLYERHGFAITGNDETHYFMAWHPAA